ncbi:CARDB domain-containing protein [Deinococcus geothermalis]|uniref:CARDB domain-containing protein n=1 Tax=Deinococcus geothermalis TaxID=68909 RepID=UPI00235347BA|nr:CARDB domain-containing protein [Deinococcus geothermalis]
MTYRAAWYLSDGTTPAPGPDLGEVKPGETKTITRKLKNIGDQALSAVQVTLVDDLPGVTVKVGDHALTPGTMYSAPGLAPGESLTVTYTRTLPADAEPGTFTAFLRIRALT